MQQSKPAIFIRGSADRKPPFQLVTVLRHSQQGLAVSKQLAHPAAAEHLASFPDKQHMLERAMQKYCRVSKATRLSEEEIGFEFAQGNSLQSLFEDALRQGSMDKAQGILERAFQLIDSLPHSRTTPTASTAYRTIFGASYDTPVNCITPACIDFNLDNLFEYQGELTIIDYEWVYDFPVPASFIKLRILQSTFLETKSLLYKYLPNEPLTIYAQNFFVPSKLCKQYKSLLIDLVPFLKTNIHFLNYLQFTQAPEDIVLDKQTTTPKEYFSDSFPSPLNKLKRSEEKIRLDEEHIRKQDQLIQELLSERNSLRQTITHRTLGRAELYARRTIRKHVKKR